MSKDQDRVNEEAIDQDSVREKARRRFLEMHIESLWGPEVAAEFRERVADSAVALPTHRDLEWRHARGAGPLLPESYVWKAKPLPPAPRESHGLIGAEQVQDIRVCAFRESQWAARCGVLIDFVRMHWGEDFVRAFADWCARQNHFHLETLPTLSDLQARWSRGEDPIPPEPRDAHGRTYGDARREVYEEVYGESYKASCLEALADYVELLWGPAEAAEFHAHHLDRMSPHIRWDPRDVPTLDILKERHEAGHLSRSDWAWAYYWEAFWESFRKARL